MFHTVRFCINEKDKFYNLNKRLGFDIFADNFYLCSLSNIFLFVNIFRVEGLKFTLGFGSSQLLYREHSQG
jgi:hypothetical protein